MVYAGRCERNVDELGIRFAGDNFSEEKAEEIEIDKGKRRENKEANRDCYDLILFSASTIKGDVMDLISSGKSFTL